jgi:hypothetical protein
LRSRDVVVAPEIARDDRRICELVDTSVVIVSRSVGRALRLTATRDERDRKKEEPMSSSMHVRTV